MRTFLFVHVFVVMLLTSCGSTSVYQVSFDFTGNASSIESISINDQDLSVSEIQSQLLSYAIGTSYRIKVWSANSDEFCFATPNQGVVTQDLTIQITCVGLSTDLVDTFNALQEGSLTVAETSSTLTQFMTPYITEAALAVDELLNGIMGIVRNPSDLSMAVGQLQGALQASKASLSTGLTVSLSSGLTVVRGGIMMVLRSLGQMILFSGSVLAESAAVLLAPLAKLAGLITALYAMVFIATRVVSLEYQWAYETLLLPALETLGISLSTQLEEAIDAIEENEDYRKAVCMWGLKGGPSYDTSQISGQLEDLLTSWNPSTAIEAGLDLGGDLLTFMGDFAGMVFSEGVAELEDLSNNPELYIMGLLTGGYYYNWDQLGQLILGEATYAAGGIVFEHMLNSAEYILHGVDDTFGTDFGEFLAEAHTFAVGVASEIEAGIEAEGTVCGRVIYEAKYVGQEVLIPFSEDGYRAVRRNPILLILRNGQIIQTMTNDQGFFQAEIPGHSFVHEVEVIARISSQQISNAISSGSISEPFQSACSQASWEFSVENDRRDLASFIQVFPSQRHYFDIKIRIEQRTARGAFQLLDVALLMIEQLCLGNPNLEYPPTIYLLTHIYGPETRNFWMSYGVAMQSMSIIYTGDFINLAHELLHGAEFFYRKRNDSRDVSILGEQGEAAVAMDAFSEAWLRSVQVAMFDDGRAAWANGVVHDYRADIPYEDYWAETSVYNLFRILKMLVKLQGYYGYGALEYVRQSDAFNESSGFLTAYSYLAFFKYFLEHGQIQVRPQAHGLGEPFDVVTQKYLGLNASEAFVCEDDPEFIWGNLEEICLEYNQQFPEVDVFDMRNLVGKAVDLGSARLWALYNPWELRFPADRFNGRDLDDNNEILVGVERFFLDYNGFVNTGVYPQLMAYNRFFVVPLSKIHPVFYRDDFLGVRGMYPIEAPVRMQFFIKGQRFEPTVGNLWGDQQGLVEGADITGVAPLRIPFDPSHFNEDDVLIVWVSSTGSYVPCFWLTYDFSNDPLHHDHEVNDYKEACQNVIDFRDLYFFPEY